MKRNIIGLMLLFLGLAGSAYSKVDIERATQPPEQIEREKIEERLEKIPEKPEIILEEAPPKKEEPKFFIKKINLVGCESFVPEVFSPIIEKYENKELGFSDLQCLAEEISREYLRRNIIAAVFAPEQEIKEQTVTLQVVETRMGELKIKEHKYFKKKRLNYYWRIKPGEILHYDKISKSTQLMDRNPDRDIKAVLTAGERPGTTDIILEVETNFPFHLTSSFDNEGSPLTGRERKTFGMMHNNFLGFDDIFLSGYTYGKDFDGIYAYHLLPISPYGTFLVYGYNHSEAEPKKEFEPFGIKSETESWSVTLSQDLFKGKDYFGEVSLGFEAKDKTVDAYTGLLNQDRLRILNLKTKFLQRDFQSTATQTLEVSQGVDAFGASGDNNPLASRGAKSTFTKFNLSLQYKRNLFFGLQTVLKFKSQLSSTKLTSQEAFGLGGINSVRGYPIDDYLADNAVLQNIELFAPCFFIPKRWKLPYAQASLREEVNLIFFFDYGWGKRRGALPTEKQSVNLLSAGLGLRISLFNQLLLRLEWGFPIASNRPLSQEGESRFHLSIDLLEKLPQEIKRIQEIKRMQKK